MAGLNLSIQKTMAVMIVLVIDAENVVLQYIVDV